jgi:hypothetical protein
MSRKTSIGSFFFKRKIEINDFSSNSSAQLPTYYGKRTKFNKMSIKCNGKPDLASALDATENLVKD